MQKLSRIFNTNLKYVVVAILLAVPLYPKFPLFSVPGTYVSIRLEDVLLGILFIFLLYSAVPRIRSIWEQKIERSILLFLGVGLVSVISGILLTKTVNPLIGILHWARRVEYFIPLFIGLLVVNKQPRTKQSLHTPLFKSLCKNPRFSHNSLKSLFTASIHPRTESPRFSGSLNKPKNGLIWYFLRVLMITIVVSFIYGFGQKYFSWPVIVTQNQEYAKGLALRWVSGSHINASFAGHYDLASFLVLVLPMFVCLLFLLKEWKSRLIVLLVVFSGLWLMANAVSRISVVSYLASITFSLLLIKKYKAIPIALLVSIFFFGMSSSLLVRYERIFNVVRTQVQKVISIPSVHQIYATEALEFPLNEVQEEVVVEDRSTSIRLDVEWPRAIRAFKKNPLLGTGYSSITLATDSDYLRLLGEVGLLGLIAFLLIFVRLGDLMIKVLPTLKKLSIPEKAFLGGIIGSIPGVLLNAAFIDVFEASKFAIIFWLLIGIAVSLIRFELNEQNT